MLQTAADNQELLQESFQSAFEIMGQLGIDRTTLTECTEVLPIPPFIAATPHFPAGKTIEDVEQAVSARIPTTSR